MWDSGRKTIMRNLGCLFILKYISKGICYMHLTIPGFLHRNVFHNCLCRLSWLLAEPSI